MKFYRLRGCEEVHLATCPHVVPLIGTEGCVEVPDPTGLQPAYCCRHYEAVAWMEAIRVRYGGK